MGWTASGGLYYQVRHGGGSNSTLQLASVDWSTGRYTSVPLGTRGHQENTATPLWSLDGKNLAYISDLRDRPGLDSRALVIRATDTGETRELRIKDLSIVIADAWAPDGRSLFVEAYDPRGGFAYKAGVYRIDVETGDATSVALSPVENGILTVAAMAPDRRSFLTRVGPPRPDVSQTNAPKSGIYRVDTQTGTFTPLVLDEPSGNAVGPRISPDGKTLYYRRGRNVFIKRDLSSGEERELARRSVLGNIHLSPDGRYIATASTDADSNTGTVLLIPTADREIRELMRVPSEVRAEDLNNTSLSGGVAVVVEAGRLTASRSFYASLPRMPKSWNFG